MAAVAIVVGAVVAIARGVGEMNVPAVRGAGVSVNVKVAERVGEIATGAHAENNVSVASAAPRRISPIIQVQL